MLKRIALVLGLLFLARAEGLAADLTAEQKADVEKIRVYLDGLKTLSGGFAQITSAGDYSDGVVHLQRPGLMHLIYNDPLQIEIIVRNGTIIYHDKADRQVSYYPLNATPLSVLLKENLSFNDDVEVVDLAKGRSTLELMLVDRNDPAMGSVSLIFTQAPFALRKWIIVDAQGITTQVTLLNPVIGSTINPQEFEFSDPRYDQQDR